jgi:hypothetical protein
MASELKPYMVMVERSIGLMDVQSRHEHEDHAIRAASNSATDNRTVRYFVGKLSVRVGVIRLVRRDGANDVLIERLAP